MRDALRRPVVVDASVLQAAGMPTSGDAAALWCTDTLTWVREICHPVVLTAEVIEEWNRHQSSAGAEWYAWVLSRPHKQHRLKSAKLRDLRREVSAVLAGRSERQVALKDIHLVEAAIKARAPIISLEWRAANVLAGITADVPRLAQVCWVNVGAVAPDRMRRWLEDGAADRPEWRLGPEWPPRGSDSP